MTPSICLTPSICFEDIDAGTVALKRMTAVDGDPGAWAALTLARRGHKDAMPRALQVFRDLAPNEQEATGSMAVSSSHGLSHFRGAT